MKNILLSIQNLQVDFISDGITSTAIRGINIEVQQGEIVAIVGESGSGKSVTSLSVLQLLPTPPALYVKGEINFTDKKGNTNNLLNASTDYLRKIRGNEISMIFRSQCLL